MEKLDINHKETELFRCFNISEERVTEIEKELQTIYESVEKKAKDGELITLAKVLEESFTIATNEEERVYITYLLGVKQGEVRAFNSFHKQQMQAMEPKKKVLAN